MQTNKKYKKYLSDRVVFNVENININKNGRKIVLKTKFSSIFFILKEKKKKLSEK